MEFDLKITVGISDFVYRQKPNSGKTYSLLSFSEIAKYAQDKLNKNELEFDLKITVGISDFVYRQKPNSGKTYSLLSFSEIAKYAQDKLNKNEFTKGYRDGVVIVKIDDELSKQFICPFVEINDDSLLKAEVARRRPDEEHYIRIKATNGKALETGSVELILYRNDVLKETNENTTDSDWELISFHALPKGIEEMPMGAVTMMRNQLQLPGGTKGYYESEKWAKSVHFWQKYAIKEIE